MWTAGITTAWTKLSLDASFQDNSYLKTWLVYHMMAYMEVPAPLCSYAG